MLFFSKTKMIATLAMVALSFYLALPNVLPAHVRSMLPLFNGPVVLGLDLQGGSHVLLEVDQATLKDQYAKQLIGDIRQALRSQKIPYSGLGRSGDSVAVRITDPSRMDAAMTELRKLQQPLDTGLFGSGGTTRQYDIRQDGDQIIFTFTPAGLEYRIGRAIEQSLDIVGKRINALGTTEPIIQRQGVDRILVQVPGLQDPGRLKDLLGQTAKLQFRLLCDSQPTSATDRPPADCEALPDQKQPNQIYWVQTSSRATVDGEDLNDAQPAFDNRTNEPIVSFRFNQQGALKFGQLTRDNVGRPFAIVLDNKVVSAPRINEPILGGSGQISGRFTTQEASDLAIVLRSGALPARLSVVEERSVGPSLGSDSIRAGIIASIIGLVTVLLFMVLCYGLFGVFAVIALVAHTIMIIGIMSFFGITLTLPGIAGLVLGMGMAVDSNVLVYERIREEMKLGRSVIGSIETGFRMAFGTIFDSNVTTLIAGMVLFGLGSGPIRGFAVTLVLGILTTIFTAFTLVRLIVATWVRLARPKVVPL